LEGDYRQLWNQLDLFDSGEEWEVLNATDSDEVSEQDKQRHAQRFLVRRLTGLRIANEKYTKNMYRREWRNGGISEYDYQLPVANEQQRLIVALVQKKVSEILGNERFNNSFQIGMLASFESFLETARKRQSDTDDKAVFDGVDQTDKQLEKEGIDTLSVNALAQSYREIFGEPMPHPKMDAVVDNLTESFNTGEKVLIFVRRVKSVNELVGKFNHRYDTWVRNYILSNLERSPRIQKEAEEIFHRYEIDRPGHSDQEDDKATVFQDGEEYSSTAAYEEEDEGGRENFFTWFFRGTGPSGVFSGAAFNRNRLSSEGSPFSLIFENNYITQLLGESDNPAQAIAAQIGCTIEEAVQRLRETAAAIFRPGLKLQRYPRRRVFFAYQEAALFLLEDANNPTIREKARVIRREQFGGNPVDGRNPPSNFPAPVGLLSTKTFFTELVKRSDVRKKLWPSEEEFSNDHKIQFRRQEQRREALSAAARLGRPFIDLWLLAVHGLGTLTRDNQKRKEYGADQLIDDYLDLLEQQQHDTSTHNAFHELAKIAENFDLILAVNVPTVRDEPLSQLSRTFGQLLGRQNPVGGVSGGVSQSLVRQFRMPGYPLLLVTTDVLQEGEDLHTFCASVIHYGISWTPSAMEQRTGRIDRIQSLTQRRLDNKNVAEEDKKLQVYYPHLKETVERLQVERVYERMNRFIRLMHRSFTGEMLKDGPIDTSQEFILPPRDIEPITEPLETLFPVKKEEWLYPQLPSKQIRAKVETQKVFDHFDQITESLGSLFKIKIESQNNEPWSFLATVFVFPDGQLATPSEQKTPVRHQPFTLFLRTATGDGRVLLRCVSPIGVVRRDDDEAIEHICTAQQQLGSGKICAVDDIKLDTYNLTVEADILFHPDTTQLEEVADLIMRTTRCADHMERALLSVDRTMRYFRDDLSEESDRA
jgi:hypothetical protein